MSQIHCASGHQWETAMGPGCANTRRADGMPIPWRDGCMEVQHSVAPGLSARDRPAFGYVIEGAVRFELEAGGTFWEPGGDPIHYQDGNALADARTRFVVTMMCAPGKPMLELVDAEELEQRAHLRAPRPTD
ncbi:cupin domain-containing protein [Streptomyces mirabilis]|uniref:cupin domain-containing protein n=1 Tax=Streptomyces mirabilis TaxID=68239 RepID=UPI003F4C8881